MEREIKINKWVAGSGWNYSDVMLDRAYMNYVWKEDDDPEEIIKAEADAIFGDMLDYEDTSIEEVEAGNDYQLELIAYEEDENGNGTAEALARCWLSDWLEEHK